MTDDVTRVTDAVTVHVNGVVPGLVPPLPKRPGRAAKIDVWRGYVVALGLHPDVAVDVDTRADLVVLADRLGG